MNTRPNIVLIHGAWAEGSCWSGVIERLQADGYRVTAPQFPLTALADDVARLRQVLDLQDGPAIVAGHSYGGQVMTALGADAPNITAWSTSPRSGLTRANPWAGCWRRDRPPPRWRTCSPTSRASAGCPKTTSSITSPATSTRSRPR